MRNSNNAIKFLLAQYRAIFKRAYIKGLAAAVIVAGMSVGAQAADLDINHDDVKGWLNSSQELDLNGDTANVVFNTSGDYNNAGKFNMYNAEASLTLTTSGSDSAVTIKTSGSSAIYSAIAGAGADQKAVLTVGAIDESATQSDLTLEITDAASLYGNSVLNVHGMNGADATLKFSSQSSALTIPTMDAVADASLPVLNITGGINSGNATLESANKLTIRNGFINLNGTESGGTATLKAKSYELYNRSYINVSGDGNYITATSGDFTFQGAEFTLNDNAVLTISANNINLDGFAYKNSSTASQYSIGSGAVLNLSGNATLASTGTGTDYSSANISNAGTINIAKDSTLTIGTQAELDNSSGTIAVAAGGTFNISEEESLSGTVENAGTVKFSDDIDISNANIANTGTVTAAGNLTVSADNFAEGQLLGESGSLKLEQDVELSFADEEVDLVKLGIIESDGSLNDAITASGENVLNAATVNLGNSYNADGLALNTDSLSVGTNFTVGENGNITTAAISFAEDAAGRDATLNLAGTLNLASSEGGTVAADVTVSGDNAALNLAEGSWNISNVAAENGTVTVNAGADLTADELTSTASGSVAVNGNLSVNKTLDLANDSVTVAATGTVTLATDLAKDIISESGSSNVSGAFTLNGGTLKVDLTDDVSLDEAALADLKKELFGAGDIGGFLNVGNAQVSIEVSGGAISWDEIESKGFNDLEITTSDLAVANVTAIATNDVVNGQYGALTAADGYSGTAIFVKDRLTLNGSVKAGDNYVQDSTDKVLGISSSGSIAHVVLQGNGGKIGAVSLTENGSTFTTAASGQVEVQGSINVSGDVTLSAASTVVTDDITAADTLKITNVASVGGDSVSAGSLSIENGVLNFTAADDTTAITVKSSSTINLNNAALQDERVTLTFGDASNAAALNSTITNGSVVDVAAITLSNSTGTHNVVIDGNASVSTDAFTGASGTSIQVGQGGASSSSAALAVGTLDLNGSTLIIDPNYDQKFALVSADKLNADNTLDGNVLIGKNSAFGVSFESEQDFRNFMAEMNLLQGNGALKEDIGAALVLSDSITLDKDYGILIDADKDALTDSDAVTGLTVNHGALILTEDAFGGRDKDGELLSETPITLTVGTGQSGAVSFNPNDSKIVLAGTFDTQELTGKTLIVAKDEQSQVAGITGNYTGTIESYNGLYTGNFSYMSSAGGIKINSIETNDERVKQVLTQASAPIQDLIVSAGNGNAIDDTAVGTKFLEYIAFNTHGQEAEAAARMAVYGGAVQSALMAQQTSSDTVADRLGMANPNSALISSSNAQGGGLWLAPVYKNSDSDGFEAQGVEYGADIDLYGLALGADYTTASGVRVGAMFNIGSGSADGQGVGSTVTNDFDYYGFTLYAGMTFGNFSLIADAGFTQLSNDLEQNSFLGKLTADTDVQTASVGVRGEYLFATPWVDVVPHVGMRYTNLDLDSYDIHSADGVLASSDADALKVFSIPFGVTFSKDIALGAWSVKPVFDITLTANAGDDELDSTTTFNGVPTVALSTEIMDSFTYGTSLGIDAQFKEAFSFGLNVGYTGSSNADEFGVNANARYTF